jgi:hypothetical protein
LHHTSCRQPCGLKLYAYNEVSRMKFLGTVVHRLTELLPNIANIDEMFIVIISLNNISLRYNEESKKLRNSSVMS